MCSAHGLSATIKTHAKAVPIRINTNSFVRQPPRQPPTLRMRDLLPNVDIESELLRNPICRRRSELDRRPAGREGHHLPGRIFKLADRNGILLYPDRRDTLNSPNEIFPGQLIPFGAV